MELAQALAAPCLVSRVSRLVIDVNRPLSSETLIRQTADNAIIAMNRNLSSEDVQMRIMKYYIPYHLAFGDAVLKFSPRVIVSVHSFNPVYEGDVRNFDVGVL